MSLRSKKKYIIMHEVTHYDITHSLSNYNINVIYVQSNGHNLEYLQVLKNNKG